MKCLSIWNPWATLVATSVKRIETRSWRTPYRGRLLIHAAAMRDADALSLCDREPFRSALIRGVGSKEMTFGAILCRCDLLACLPIGAGSIEHSDHSLKSPVVIPPEEPERSFGDYRAGRWAWVLGNVRPFQTPIPYRGAQGLFEVPDQFIQEHLAAEVLR